jgi:adenylate cyclase
LNLIKQTLGVNEFPEDAFSIIRHKSGGQPLFAISLAKAWQENEAIQILNGFCKISTHLDDLNRTAVPVNVQRIITGRIERLAPSLQLLLKFASVIGEQFTLDDLKATFPDYQGEEALLEQLSLLSQLGFIEFDESANSYHFQNGFLREVCYGLLPASLRIEIPQLE